MVEDADLEMYPIPPPGLSYMLGNGGSLTPRFYLDISFVIGGRPYYTYTERFLVVENAPYDTILGARFCEEHKIFSKAPEVYPHFLQQTSGNQICALL